jgi:ribonuclease HI
MSSKRFMSSVFLLQFDGGCNSNPGSGGSGCVIYANSKKIVELASYHQHTTNNEAEYNGLILGLKYLQTHTPLQLQIQGDSMLVVKQLLGEYKVKAKNLQPLFEQSRNLLKLYDVVKIEHIPRKDNEAADQLSNEVRVLKDDICREFIEHS